MQAVVYKSNVVNGSACLSVKIADGYIALFIIFCVLCMHSLLNNGVSHNLRLCALKFPTDFSNGYILDSGGVKDYIASSK